MLKRTPPQAPRHRRKPGAAREADPSIEVISQVVNNDPAFADEVRVVAEPGRYLVSDGGYFVCVVGTTTRRQAMHWDAGLFGE
jgi:ornithine decarboxylase